MIIAAALCPATPLLARELTGQEAVVPELRESGLAAAAGLLADQPDVVAVVGPASATGRWDPRGRLDVAAFAPAIAEDAAAGPALPPSLGLGARLLDQAGYAGSRLLQAVGPDEPAEHCAEIGADLAGAAARVALLVMGDGSARRSRRAPGHLDERSEAFDAEVERAVRDGDLGALLAIDAQLARDLMATGRAAWQVLAGAVDGKAPAATIRYRDDPFGVAYLVASLDIPQPSP
jgi:hypothetical protein